MIINIKKDLVDKTGCEKSLEIAESIQSLIPDFNNLFSKINSNENIKIMEFSFKIKIDNEEVVYSGEVISE